MIKNFGDKLDQKVFGCVLVKKSLFKIGQKVFHFVSNYLYYYQFNMQFNTQESQRLW